MTEEDTVSRSVCCQSSSGLYGTDFYLLYFSEQLSRKTLIFSELATNRSRSVIYGLFIPKLLPGTALTVTDLIVK